MLKNKIWRLPLYALSYCLLVFFLSCAGLANSRDKEPEWVHDPYTKYDRQTNVAAVGSGSSRQTAEKSALGNLVAVFGQSIQVDEKISIAYEEAVKSGVTASWAEDTVIDNTIATSTGLDSLVGAEIGDAWYDGGRNYYTVAVLNKTKAIQIYTNMINSNQAMINNLVDVSAADKNTLEGFSRFQFAATIADINISYGNLLSVIGAPGLALGLKKGDDYRLEASNIAKAIPINLVVQNDISGRIRGAFAKALGELGFPTSAAASRYALNVNVSSAPVDLPNNQNKFTRVEVSADLTDTSAGTVLLPYNFNNREGHLTQAEADNRAITAAERKIENEYADILSGYFTQLLPKR